MELLESHSFKFEYNLLVAQTNGNKKYFIEKYFNGIFNYYYVHFKTKFSTLSL